MMAETKQPPRCPVCGKPAMEATRPFCGKRCADIDLGRWFTGQYRVPASEDAAEEDPSEPA
jgi:hypothetical protein